MSPIVKPPVTTIGTVATLFAVVPIVAFVKFVAENVFPHVTIPVLKLLTVAVFDNENSSSNNKTVSIELSKSFFLNFF